MEMRGEPPSCTAVPWCADRSISTSAGGDNGCTAAGAAGLVRQRGAVAVAAADHVQRQPLLDPTEQAEQLLLSPSYHRLRHLPPPPPSAALHTVFVLLLLLAGTATRRPVLVGGGLSSLLLFLLRRRRPVPLERVAAQEHPPGAVVLVPEAPRRLHRRLLLLLADLPVDVVRQDSLPDLLRRYPQVLHASVVVDLAPVVKYLQGMDVRPGDVPRVLERYPELLGFKLEGTMSTSVAYLVGLGVPRRHISSVITRFPELLGMRVGKIIKPFVEHLEGIGLQRSAIARIIEKKPYILGFGLEDKVKPNIEALLEFGVRKETLASIVAQYPDILGIELRDKLVAQQILFESSILVSDEDFGRVIERMPQAISLGRAAALKHVNLLTACGFLLSQVSKMVVACPHLLALNMDIMEMSFEYFQNEMERDLEELVEFPAFFTYGLESTVRPRHQMVAKKGFTCSLAWLLNCSDAKFDERMKYDTIGIEEMEAEDSFNMNASSQQVEDEEEDEDLDEDSDYEDNDDDFIE